MEKDNEKHIKMLFSKIVNFLNCEQSISKDEVEADGSDNIKRDEDTKELYPREFEIFQDIWAIIDDLFPRDSQFNIYICSSCAQGWQYNCFIISHNILISCKLFFVRVQRGCSLSWHYQIESHHNHFV